VAKANVLTSSGSILNSPFQSIHISQTIKLPTRLALEMRMCNLLRVEASSERTPFPQPSLCSMTGVSIWRGVSPRCHWTKLDPGNICLSWPNRREREAAHSPQYDIMRALLTRTKTMDLCATQVPYTISPLRLVFTLSWTSVHIF
jgi:hypothetical protein